MKPILPHERYIVIGGENWSAALGTDAKFLAPKVGIFLCGPDHRPMREQVEHMAFMSANAEMTMHPLLQIMEVMQETFARHGKTNPSWEQVVWHFQGAIDEVRTAKRLLDKK